jgi:hypothetical protein
MNTLTIKASRKVYFAAALLVVVALVLPLLIARLTSAAALTQTFVRFDRMQTSTPTTGTVCAKPATAATEAHVQVTFPTGYTLGAAGTFTTSTANLAWPAGATAWLGIGTATNVTTQTVTFPSTDLVVGTLYCFNWTNTAAVQVSSSATNSNSGSVTTQDSVPATIDTATYSTASVTSDQILVTATVPQAFSFALSGTTDGLGTLSTGSVSASPTPRTATVNTNAKSGWNVWANSTLTNGGLRSASASYTIASNCSTGTGTNSTLSSGTEGYNTGVTQTQTSGSGAITVATPFVGGVLGKGGGLCGALQTLATSTGTANNAVLTLTNNAAIGSTTPAASDYTDTITVVGAGLF